MGAIRASLPSDGDTREVAAMLVATLGVLAAVLVGLATASTLQAGFTAVGAGFTLAAGTFVATLIAYEFGRRFGAA